MNYPRIIPSKIENMIVHCVLSGKKTFVWQAFSVNLDKPADRLYCREVLEISIRQYKAKIYYGSNSLETLEKCLTALQ